MLCNTSYIRFGRVAWDQVASRLGPFKNSAPPNPWDFLCSDRGSAFPDDVRRHPTPSPRPTDRSAIRVFEINAPEGGVILDVFGRLRADFGRLSGRPSENPPVSLSAFNFGSSHIPADDSQRFLIQSEKK
jgi:hypothetical protein